MEKLIQTIHNRALRLAVLGSGYVGLPTAALFADTGFTVTAMDIRPEVVKAINNGTCPNSEPGLHALVARNTRAGRLKAMLKSTEALNKIDAIMVSVQTPIDHDKKPNLSFLMNATEDVGKATKKNTLVVTMSTVPPGTMLEQVRPKIESLSDLEADTDFYLAYVPERIAPGKALAEFTESQRLVGGVGPNSTKIAAELFRTVCRKVVETDAATAEVAKLAENTFRDVNIAFANQLALICEQRGVDVAEVIRLANTHPRVNIHAPGPGVGGPCLPKDPYLLIHRARIQQQNIIETARMVNNTMPKHVVKLILQALRKAGKSIERSKIAVLGTSYKADVDDSRSSPSEPIIRDLLRLCLDVAVYDPKSKESFGANKIGSLRRAVKNADCVVITVAHDEFKRLDLQGMRSLMNNEAIIVDGARTVDPYAAKNLGFTYFGIGFGVSNSS